MLLQVYKSTAFTKPFPRQAGKVFLLKAQSVMLKAKASLRFPASGDQPNDDTNNKNYD